MRLKHARTVASGTIGLWLLTAAGWHMTELRGEETTAPVQFSGGHEIGPGDFGRPVVLIAAALEVKPDQFRKAFSGVTPARGRGPSREEARKNKAALMRVLAPLGVTNDRLDDVSDYYRFRPESGKLWPTRAAKAHAVLENGKIRRIVVDDPGAGYCSVPAAAIEGYPAMKLTVLLHLDTDLRKNGGVESVQLGTIKTPKGRSKKP
jgi:hypothetical protein